MNKDDIRKLMKEDFVEITQEEYINLEDIGKSIFYCPDETIYFKPKQKFPIIIKTQGGEVEINDLGGIGIFASNHNKINYIARSELEQFEEIIKKAKEVRDEKKK